MSGRQSVAAFGLALALVLPLEAVGAQSIAIAITCGVERWSVKTGTDADANLINLGNTTPTTIASLTALPAPTPIPPNNRVQPTETTVFSVTATLTVYKREDDSDYHLVISDGNGQTMITEIADPQCVGAGSPLLPGIQNARAEFDTRIYNRGGMNSGGEGDWLRCQLEHHLLESFGRIFHTNLRCRDRFRKPSSLADESEAT